MSHYRRVYVPGACYFFTVVTWRRTPIFIDEQRVEIFRQAIRKIMQTRPFHIDAMVILPDHLHCIWSMPDGDDDFSSRWREIKKATSRQIDAATNAHNERLVWQRRFWEHAIRDEDDSRRHMDYIHYNPVKHGLAQRPADWPWSSFASAVKKGWYAASWGTQVPTTILHMDCE